MPRPTNRALLALAFLLTLGCAPTAQTVGVQPAGFLGDYSQLRPGEGDQAQLVYLNEAARFAAYSAVMIDPVRIWRTPESDLDDVPREELHRLADHLYGAMEAQLKQDYAIARQPGPATLRVRAAITEAKGSKVALDVVSTVVPQMRLISRVKQLATGTHTFVGRAAVEAEVVDSVSGERLLAAVDERAGAKALRGSTSTWADVEQAFDFWAERLRTRLSELRVQQP